MKTVQGIKPGTFLAILLLTYSVNASAQLTNQGVLDQVVVEFSTRASSWQTVVMNAASWLFWTLGTISFTWTMAMLALRKADIGDFFAEFIRFVLFFGFFYWLLQNGRPSRTRSFARFGSWETVRPEQRDCHPPASSMWGS